MQKGIIYFSQIVMGICIAVALGVTITATKTTIGIYVTLLLLLSICVLLFDSWRNKNTIFSDDNIKDILIGLGLGILFFFVYKSAMADVSIWLDEATDGDSALTDYDITKSAAYQQQPPLAYIFRRLGLNIFGINPFGLRISSILFAALFITQMYWGFVYITKRRWLSFFGAIMLGFNTLIFNYSFEARMYSMSLYAFSFVLIQLLDRLSHYENKTDTSKWNWPLFVAFLVWLLTVSMQPFTFIFGLVLMTTLYSLYKRKVSHWGIAWPAIGASIFAVPLLTVVMNSSRPYLVNSVDFNKIVNSIVHFDYRLLEYLIYGNSTEKVIIPGLLLVVLFDLILSRKKNFIGAFLTLVALLFLATTITTFFALTNWFFNPRYLITLIPIFYLILVLFLDRRFAKKPIFATGLLAFFTVTIVVAGVIEKRPRGPHFGWRSLYSSLSQKLGPKSKVYYTTFEMISRFQDEYMVTARYYGEIFDAMPKLKDAWPKYSNGDLLVDDIIKGDSPDKIFFIYPLWYPNPISPQQILRMRDSRISTDFYNDIVLFTVSVRGSFLDSAIYFFETFSKSVKPSPHWFKLYDILIGLYSAKGDCENTGRAFALLKETMIPFNGRAYVRYIKAKRRLFKSCLDVGPSSSS